MGPCHTEKTTRQVDGGKPFHSKGSLEYVMANSSPAPHQIKPKLLFNLLVNDNEEYQRPKSGYLKPFDADAHGSFRQSSECISFNPATCKEPTSFKPEALNQHFRKDLDHMAKVEMTRNKLKILLTEPYDKGTDCLSRSFSEPITPPPVRNMLELGKRTNSEGSQYRSLILKKRQKDMMLSPTSKESPLLPEDQLKNKRMKNGLNHVEQSNSSFSGRIPSQFENMSKKHETSLLKKLLSRVADDDSEPEYPSISGGICCPMRRLADNRRSLSNSDIYSTSTLTSFLTPYLSMSQPIRRVNYAVKLANSTNDLLFSYLCNSVQYALRLPGFDLLPVDDKRSMIIKAAPRLILLSMAKENYHLEVCVSEEPDKENNGEESSKPTIDFVESLKLFIKRFQQHQITDKEFSYLKHIALYQYNDPNKPLAASEQVKKKLLEVFDGLRDLTSEDKTRHSQLLLQLHSLFQLDLKTLETLFFQPLLQSVESLKKLKHLYSDGAWMPADGKNQERSMIVSL